MCVGVCACVCMQECVHVCMQECVHAGVCAGVCVYTPASVLVFIYLSVSFSGLV